MMTDMAAWRRQVEADLKGAPFDKALTTRTLEGILLQPLYVEGPALPPGVGRAGAFHVAVRQDHMHKGLGAQLRDAAEGGASAVWLTHVDGGGMADVQAELRRFGAVRVEAPGQWARAAAWCREQLPGSTQVVLPLDPLESTVGGQPQSVAEGMKEAAALHASSPAHWRLVGVSTQRHHGCGAHAVQELGILLASGVAYLRALEVLGVSPSAAAGRVVLTLPVGRDVFMELAKLRAARLLWARVLQASGVVDAPATLVHAVGSDRTLTVKDAHVNMLRSTTQAFAGMLGGADVMALPSWDARLDSAGERGARVARNTGLVLALESHLDAVVDPARGSYFLDALTQELCTRGWGFFQEIEKRGGMEAVLAEGWLRAQVDATHAERTSAFRKRKDAITGVSAFALPVDPARALENPAENPGQPAAWPVRRDADAFEHVRARAEGMAPPPSVFLARLGSTGEAGARLQFAAHFFQAGGVHVSEEPDATHWNAGEAAASVLEHFKASGARDVCLCGPDSRYAESAAAWVTALRAAGARRVWLAGKPGELEPALNAAGVSGFIHLGMDVVDALERFLSG